MWIIELNSHLLVEDSSIAGSVTHDIDKAKRFNTKFEAKAEYDRHFSGTYENIRYLEVDE